MKPKKKAPKPKADFELSYIFEATPLAVYNIAILLGFAFCGYGAYVLGRVLTRSVPAGLVAGILYSFVNFRTDDDDVRALEEVRESIQRMLAQAGVNHEIAGSELGDKLEAIRVRNAEAKAQAELADLKRKRRPPLAPMDIFTAAANAANGDIKHAN